MAKKDAKTLRGVSADAFEAFLKKAAAKDYEQAAKSEIDVKKIISGILENNPASSPAVGVSLFKSFVARELDILGSELYTGVLVGMRDQYQKNRPAQLCILYNDSQRDPPGFEVSSWDTRLLYNGVREHLPEPCNIELAANRNAKYNSLEAASVESYSPIADDDFRVFLKERAVNPGDINENDKYNVFVFKGVIDKVQPVSRFEDGEVTGVYRVVERNGLTDPIAHPVLQIKMLKSLSSDGKVSTLPTVIFNRCRNTVPNIMIDDVIDLCNEAAAKYTEPRSQAELVENGLKGREVMVVGIVTSYKFVRDTQYGETVFLNIGGVCIIDFEAPVEISDVKQTGPGSEVKKTREKRGLAGGKAKKVDEATAAPPEKPYSKVDELVDKILKYCATLKISPDELSLDEVSGMVDPDVQGSVVLTALKCARDIADPDRTV